MKIKLLVLTCLILMSIGCSINDDVSIVGENMKKIEANDKDYNFETGQISLIPLGDSRIHFQPKDGWLGDAHPIYVNGKWYLYYLKLPFTTKNRGTLEGVKQALAVSTDLVNWEEVEVSIDKQGRDWWAIANTVFKGKMYSMFNDVITNSGYGLAISDNMKDFEEYGVVYPYSWVNGNEPRDPSVFYDEVNDIFYFLHATKNYSDLYEIAQGEVYYSTTKDFINFSQPELLYRPNNANVAECNEFFRLGDYYYLIMNWGTNRVGGARYRILKELGGNFIRIGPDTFQSTEFMAPNSATDGSRRVTFGWIPTYQGNRDGGNWQWGGTLALPLNLYNNQSGQLFVKPAFNNDLIREKQVYPTSNKLYDWVSGDGWYLDEKDFVYKENSSYGEIFLDGNYRYFDMSVDVKLGQDNAGVGISFRTGNKNFNGYEIFLDPITRQIIFRNHFERRESLVSVPASIEYGKTYQLRLIVDGPIVEVYLDNKYALSARAHVNTTKNKIGLFSEYGSASFSNIEIYELKEIYNVR